MENTFLFMGLPRFARNDTGMILLHSIRNDTLDPFRMGLPRFARNDTFFFDR